MKSKKLGFVAECACAAAVLAGAIWATTASAQQKAPAPPGSCCHTQPCASGGSLTACNPEGGCVLPEVCLGAGGGTSSGCWSTASCGPQP